MSETADVPLESIFLSSITQTHTSHPYNTDSVTLSIPLLCDLMTDEVPSVCPGVTVHIHHANTWIHVRSGTVGQRVSLNVSVITCDKFSKRGEKLKVTLASEREVILNLNFNSESTEGTFF